MSVFRQQMAYVDSMQKANDTELKAENERRAAQARLLAEQVKPLIVHKAHENMDDFNTVRPQSHEVLIAAMIDEEVTAFAGSRIRLHLLEDIWAGQDLIRKGSCLYGLVTGFTAQRVNITVSSLLSDGRLLPVKLSVYDLDGMQGLYVPSSAFREFTKDLAGNTMQGVTIGNGSSGGQFLMSSVDKMFQSASSAIAGAIRKNKAKVKYGTYVYLLDPQILQNNH
jgi:conjugative transposon TraM protein